MKATSRPEAAGPGSRSTELASRRTDSSTEERRRQPPARRWWPGALCCGLYAVLALVVFGHVDALGPGHLTGVRTPDVIEQVWWLAWTEFALLHGHDVFLAQWQNYPLGENFGVNGSMLALGVLFLPVTKVFGPIVSWNIAVRCALAISATSMCLVLRRWVTWWPAAFVGGLLYGFSPYVLHSASALLFLVFVPLPPVFFLLLDEILVRQKWRPATAGALLGAVCVLQFFIWSEIMVSMAIMGLIATAIFVVLHRDRVSRTWRYAAKAFGVTAAVALVLLLPPALFTLYGPQNTHGSPTSAAGFSQFPSDLLGAVVPTSQWLTTNGLTASANARFPYATAAYIGAPLIAILVVFAILFRKRGPILFAGAMALVALVLSLGPRLWVDGNQTALPLPFAVLAHLPVVNGLVAVRLSLYTAMFAAAMLSLGLDELRRRLSESGAFTSLSPNVRRLAASGACVTIAAVAVVALVPGHSPPVATTNIPSTFTSAGVDAIPEGSVVLGYPYPDSSGPNLFFQPTHDLMLDQAAAGMRFKLIGGYGWFPSSTGPRGTSSPVTLSPKSVQALFDSAFYGFSSSERMLLSQPKARDQLRAFLRRYDVAAVVVLPEGADPGGVARDVISAIGCPVASQDIALWLHVQERLGSDDPSPTAGTSCTDLPTFPPNQFLPDEGSTVTGGMILDATVNDYLRVTSVEYYLSSRSMRPRLIARGVSTSVGWFSEWNSATVPNGSYTVRCVAVDIDGRRTESPGRTITVKN